MGTRKIKRTSESLDESLMASKKGRRNKSKVGSKAKKKQSFFAPLKKISRTQVLYTLLGVLLFCVFLVAKIPFDRFGGNVLVEMSKATNMDFDAKKVEFSFLLGPKVIFTDLLVRTKPSSRMRRGGNSKLAEALSSDGILIKELSFRPSILQLIQSQFKKGAVPGGSFSAEAFGGDISGSFSMITKLEAELYVEDVSLSQIEVLQKVSKVRGTISDLDLEFSAQRARLGNANGEMTVSAEGLEFNPGVFVNDNFVKSLGVLKLGDLTVESNAKNGRLRFNQFSLKGKQSDLQANISGEMRLNDVVDRSAIDLVVRVTPGAKLRPILENPLLTTIFAKDPAGNFGVKLEGSLLRPIPKPYKPGS